MRYPVLIEPATDECCFSIVVPDFPGCFSAGDTLEEAIRNAERSASAWIAASTEPVPPPSPMAEVRALEPDWIVSYINVRRRGLTLAEMNAMCDPTAPLSAEDRQWLSDPPVGCELI